tara:strand:- start:4603 stop:4842 length:240 start_codon:yes stop_codon:yes gene_type:complete
MVVDINGAQYWVVEDLDRILVEEFGDDIRKAWKVMGRDGVEMLLLQFRSGKAYNGMLLRDREPNCMMVEWCSLFKDFVH